MKKMNILCIIIVILFNHLQHPGRFIYGIIKKTMFKRPYHVFRRSLIGT